MGIYDGMAYRLFFSMALVLFCFGGCKKADDGLSDFVKQKVVLFDDDNAHSGFALFEQKILAGNNRLFMIYPHGTEGSSLNDDRIQTCFIVSDNNGQLIKMGKIPAPSYAFNALARPDGSFHVIVGDYDQTYRLIIYHFNGNGDYTGKDTVLIKNGYSFYSVMVNAAGNFILRNWNTSTQGLPTQFQEVNLKGEILWTREFNFNDNQWPVIAVRDGYLLTPNVISDSILHVINYNSQLDTNWHKSYKIKLGFRFTAAVSAFPFDNKYLIDIIEYKAAGTITGVDPSLRRYRYFLSQDGDSLSFRTNPNSRIVYNPNSFVKLNNGHTFYTTRYKNQHTNSLYLSADELFTKIQVVDNDLNLVKEKLIQSQSIDYLVSACRTSDGRIACFGAQQIYSKARYKPALILMNE